MYAKFANMHPDEFKHYKPDSMAERAMFMSMKSYASTGDTRAIRDVWEYVIGRPQIDIPEHTPVKIVFGVEGADL